jgi:hypothetical protein
MWHPLSAFGTNFAGCSVGKVRWRTQATGLSFIITRLLLCNIPTNPQSVCNLAVQFVLTNVQRCFCVALRSVYRTGALIIPNWGCTANFFVHLFYSRSLSLPLARLNAVGSNGCLNLSGWSYYSSDPPPRQTEVARSTMQWNGIRDIPKNVLHHTNVEWKDTKRGYSLPAEVTWHRIIR